MRTIKFRAWVVNSVVKEMIYSNTIELNSACAHSLWHKVGFITNRPDEYENQIEQWQKDIVWLQFTGQKDKNGKEIYEGDVLQTQIGKLDLVVFIENGFYGKAKHPHDKNRIISNPLCSDYLTNKEVIGNIYENQGLLSTLTAVL